MSLLYVCYSEHLEWRFRSISYSYSPLSLLFVTPLGLTSFSYPSPTPWGSYWLHWYRIFLCFPFSLRLNRRGSSIVSFYWTHIIIIQFFKNLVCLFVVLLFRWLNAYALVSSQILEYIKLDDLWSTVVFLTVYQPVWFANIDYLLYRSTFHTVFHARPICC